MLTVAFIIALLSPLATIAFLIYVWRYCRSATRAANLAGLNVEDGHGDAVALCDPMDRAQFWAIIGRTTSHRDPDAQVVALRHELDRLSADEIASFQVTFDELMKESYSWDLWGALYVAHGGASDDAFDYFRAWLISKGEEVFETIMSDPDSLADHVALGNEPLDFEGFAYVAGDAWEAKTGRDSEEMPRLDEAAYIRNPLGTPFDEDGAHLARRYPKLWERFGFGAAR